MNTIPTQQSGCDCEPCPEATSGGTGPAGPVGATGAAGADGSDGLNAFTTTTAGFTMPAVSASVTVDVEDSTWMAVGQVVYVNGAGYFSVNSKPDATHASLTNLGYTGNVAPTTAVAGSKAVSPGGVIGNTGAAGTAGSLSPTTTKGDIIVDNGANSPASSVVRLASGADGTSFVSDAAQATGRNQVLITPLTVTNDNNIPRFNGTSGVPMPLQDSKLLITDDGAIQSTPSGGNARGSMAVDLQVDRAAVTQVASGANATVPGGKNNTASAAGATVGGGQGNISSAAQSTVAGGVSNTASASHATVAGGSSNAASAQGATISGGNGATASGIYSTVAGGIGNQVTAVGASVGGGQSNSASGDDSTVAGGNANTASGDNSAVGGGIDAVADKYGQSSQSSGKFSAQGDAQTSVLVMRVSTADATPTDLFLDGASVELTIGTNTTWAFRILIVARRTDVDDEGAAYQLLGAIDRNSGVGTTALIGAVTKTVIAEDTAAWDVAATADVVSGALTITVTGEAGKAIKWVARVELTEVTG